MLVHVSVSLLTAVEAKGIVSRQEPGFIRRCDVATVVVASQ